MASKHSYKITVSNNKTEKEAIDYLLSLDKNFLMPTKEGRKVIMESLKLDKKFSRAFDLFYVKEGELVGEDITVDDASKITLVELKTTQKYLPSNPEGFFFGATKNEFDIAANLKEQYKFCFVSLHPDSLGYSLLTLEELEKKIKHKRVQYQINL